MANSLDNIKGTLGVLLNDLGFRDTIKDEIGGMLEDPEIRDLLKAFAQDIWFDIVHAIRGAKMSQEARDLLMKNLTPEARIEISKADLATLQRGNCDREKLNALLGKVGQTFGVLLVSAAKAYLPVP